MCNISLFPFSSLFTEKTASFFYEAVNSSNSVLDGHCVGYGNNTRITYCFYCVIGGEGVLRYNVLQQSILFCFIMFFNVLCFMCVL